MARPCGCGDRGRHKPTCDLASPPKAKVIKEPRACGCSALGRHKKECGTVSAVPILMEVMEDDEVLFLGGANDDEEVEWIRPTLTWLPDKKRQKTVEKRIRSLMRRRRSFYLDTINFDSERETWFVDSFSWVTQLDPETGIYSEYVGHLKNCLQFLGGSKGLWEPINRSPKRVRRYRRGLGI